MKSSSTHISRSLFKLGGSRGHQPGEHSGYGYPEIHLQKMGFRCSQEAPRQKPECHSIISDFNSSSSNNNHTGKFRLLALLLLLLPSTLVQPLAVVTHTPPCLGHAGTGSDSGDPEMVVWKENPHGGGRRKREGEGSLV